MIRTVAARWSRAVPALVLGASLVACASDKSTTATDDGPADGRQAEGPTVDIVNEGSSWEFKPKAIEVPVGTEVTWTNSSNAPHNVVFEDKSLPEGKIFDPEKRYTATLTKAGTFGYICTIHPTMKAEVTVK